jgi:hypothetical protein
VARADNVTPPQQLSGFSIQRERDEFVAFARRQENAITSDNRRRSPERYRCFPGEILLSAKLRRQSGAVSYAGAIWAAELQPVVRGCHCRTFRILGVSRE